MTDTSKSAFTPGPWSRTKYGELVGSNGDHVKLQRSGIAIVGGGDGDAEALANTALVHAAPDLYEALQEALSVLDTAAMYGLYQPGSLGEADVKDCREQINAALAKASPSSSKGNEGC